MPRSILLSIDRPTVYSPDIYYGDCATGTFLLSAEVTLYMIDGGIYIYICDYINGYDTYGHVYAHHLGRLHGLIV